MQLKVHSLREQKAKMARQPQDPKDSPDKKRGNSKQKVKADPKGAGNGGGHLKHKNSSKANQNEAEESDDERKVIEEANNPANLVSTNRALKNK